MMKSAFQRSKEYIQGVTRYQIDETSIVVLDETGACWIAEVTTTHLTDPGEENIIFCIYVVGPNFSIIEQKHYPILSNWFQSRIKND